MVCESSGGSQSIPHSLVVLRVSGYIAITGAVFSKLTPKSFENYMKLAMFATCLIYSAIQRYGNPFAIRYARSIGTTKRGILVQVIGLLSCSSES